MIGATFPGESFPGGMSPATTTAFGVSADDSVAVTDAASRAQSMARSASDTPLLGGQNRCWNPGVENNANSWGWYTYVGGSVVNSAGRVTSDAFRGAACLEVNFTAGSTPQVEANCVLEPTDLLAAGTILCCRIAVKITGPLTANSQIQGMLRGTKASDGSFLFETQYGGQGALGIVKPPVSGQWYEMYGTVTIPPNTGSIQVSCFVSHLTNGQTYTLHVDGGFACITPSVDTFFPYNDGSSTGWRWTGTAGNSPSRSTVPDLAAIAPINLPRTGTDTVTVSDANSVTGGLPRSASDADAVSDSATRAVQSSARSAADAASESDAATQAVSVGRTAGDTAPASDAAPAITGRTRLADDTISASDSATRLVTATAASNDTLTASDSALGRAGLLRMVSDALTDTDAASHGVVGAQRAGTDTLSATDNAIRLVVLRRLGLDSLAASDSADRLLGLQRRTGEDAVEVDDASTVRGYVRHAFENVAVSDGALRGLLTLWRAVSDDVAVSERAVRRVALRTLASDSTAVDDAVTAVLLSLVRNGRDRVAVFDAARALIHLLPRIPVMVASNATPSEPFAGSAPLAEPMVASAAGAIVLTGGLVAVEGT